MDKFEITFSGDSAACLYECPHADGPSGSRKSPPTQSEPGQGDRSEILYR
jgi:hypothetical protein